tara:strand:- start:130 stop:564 length:435 start_codon:yes stop_codon:yes gene_type:complete
MKVQNSLNLLNKSLTTFNKDYDHIIDNIQKGYVTDLVKYQEDLLLKISTDYNLDYDQMHDKYLKNFKKNFKKSKKNQLIDIDDNSESAEINSTVNEMQEIENILEKHEIDGKVCFIENKEGGTIYNNEVIKVGEVKSGKFILYK